MPRAPDARVPKAKALFDQGLKLIEISQQLGIPEGTVRSWKNRYQWKATLQSGKRNAANKKGGQPGNKNATGPPENRHAEKYGFFSKYLPEETKEIFDGIAQADPLDLLWHQIQIAYAAIVRAQKIMHVTDRNDKTKSKVGKKSGNVIGAEWEIQHAWDKQANFLKAQARAQGEFRSLIKQYDAMLKDNWELATEEQRRRIELLKAQASKIHDGGRKEETEDKISRYLDMLGGEIDGTE